MDYTTRIVKSTSGLTQHEALLALQNHRQFQAGTKIASIHNQGGHWVAKLLVPKTATEDVKPCEHCEDKGCQHCKKTASPVDAIGNWADKGTQPLQDLAQGVGNAASDAIGNAGGLANDIAGGIANNANDIMNGDFGAVPGNAADMYSQIGGDIAGNAGDAINDIAGGASNAAGSAMDNAKGTWNTMNDAANGVRNLFSNQRRAGEAFEDIDESPADLHDDMHEMSESPFEEMEEHKGEGSTDKKIAELEKKIDLLLDALGISEKGESMDEMPEGPSADLPAAPKGPKGPSKSEPLPTGSGAKLKPGEVPNKPGMTPVGSPAFASVKTANPSMPPAAPATGTASGPVGAPMAGQGCTCPPGQPCSCGASTASNAAAPASPSASGPVMSFTASKADPNRDVSIRMAKAQLENTYQGFRVARIKRDGDYIHALVTR